jgi:hypothetical protein
VRAVATIDPRLEYLIHRSVVFCPFADTVGEPQPGVGASLAK